MNQKIHERNKKYEWLVFFTALNWVTIGLVIWKIDPEDIKNFIVPSSYLPMMFLIMGGVFWLFSIILLSAVKALRWSIVTVLFLYLRIFGLGTLLNFILILGLMVTYEVYTHKAKSL